MRNQVWYKVLDGAVWFTTETLILLWKAAGAAWKGVVIMVSSVLMVAVAVMGVAMITLGWGSEPKD